jgi:opacity protein-like surface antigen
MLDLVPGRTYPFAETGLGVVKQDIKFDNYSDSETDFMWTIGGGVWVMLSKSIALDFSGSFDFVVAGSEENSIGMKEVVYGYIFNLNAGVSFLL